MIAFFYRFNELTALDPRFSSYTSIDPIHTLSMRTWVFWSDKLLSSFFFVNLNNNQRWKLYELENFSR